MAAGRGQIKKLKVAPQPPRRHYFIGDPRGADVTIQTPPTTFEGIGEREPQHRPDAVTDSKETS